MYNVICIHFLNTAKKPKKTGLLFQESKEYCIHMPRIQMNMAFYIEDIQRPPVYKMQFTGFIESLQMKSYTLESFRNTF